MPIRCREVGSGVGLESKELDVCATCRFFQFGLNVIEQVLLTSWIAYKPPADARVIEVDECCDKLMKSFTLCQLTDIDQL